MMCDDDNDDHFEVPQQQYHHLRCHGELLSSCGLQADEWSYVGEGGRHAVFVQEVEGIDDEDDDDPPCPERTTSGPSSAGTRVRLSSPLRKSPPFRILRVAKDDLARCGEEEKSLLADATSPDATTQSLMQGSENHSASVAFPVSDCNNLPKPDPSRQDAFLSSIVALLAPYVDRPHSVKLSGQCLHDLRRRALLSGRIPPARQPDWAPPPNKGVPRWSEPAGGTLWRDYRELPQTYVANPWKREPAFAASPTTICIELKPKAGYCATSPLVHPERRSKYYCSRFVLLQELWKQGVVHKPWAHPSFTTVVAAPPNDAARRRRLTSAYDPLDLFSMDRIRISRALESLFANPQNNLKLWLQRKQLLSGGPNDDGWGAVGQALRIPSTDRNSSSTLAFILSEILAHEPFLQRLVDLQQLDVLDGDGAVRVSMRLIELCGGDQTLAESLVNDHSAMTESNVASLQSPHELLNNSPFVPPDDPSLVTQLCEMAQEIRDLVRAHECVGDGTIPGPFVEELHQRAKNLVAALQIDACCYLLQNWLLSLTMNDISFFLTLRVSDERAANGSQSQDTSSTGPKSKLSVADSHDKGPMTPLRLQMMSLQSVDEPGLAMLFTEHTPTCLLQYQIKVIDWDPKPAKKLRARESKEKIFSCPTLQSFATSRASASKTIASKGGQGKVFIDADCSK